MTFRLLPDGLRRLGIDDIYCVFGDDGSFGIEFA